MLPLDLCQESERQLTSPDYRAALAAPRWPLPATMRLVPPPPETLLAFDRAPFTPGLRVAVALSGGADSTALLRLAYYR